MDSVQFAIKNGGEIMATRILEPLPLALATFIMYFSLLHYQQNGGYMFQFDVGKFCFISSQIRWDKN